MAKIGLVLSGGGARGIAHLGVLQAMEDLGVTPDCISGVSAGAIVGALYLAGHKPKQILKMAKDQASLSLARLVFNAGGIFSSAGLKHILNAAIITDDFSCLKRQLYVTATDMVSGTPTTFSKGALFDALVGSAAVPGLTMSVKYRRYMLVDGGITNNFPVECLLGQCDFLIGVHVNRYFNKPKSNVTRLELFDRCFHLAIAQAVHAKTGICNLLIEPDLSGYGMFNMKCADAIFKRGYNALFAQKTNLMSSL